MSEYKNLFKALSEFHHKNITLQKTAVGITGNREYSYTPLDSVLEAIREPLRGCGLGYLQTPMEGGKFQTIIFHIESGEHLAFKMDLPCRNVNDPREYGQSITYCRRYQIVPILGLIAETDTDAAPSPDTKESQAEVSRILRAVCAFTDLGKCRTWIVDTTRNTKLEGAFLEQAKRGMKAQFELLREKNNEASGREPSNGVGEDNEGFQGGG